MAVINGLVIHDTVVRIGKEGGDSVKEECLSLCASCGRAAWVWQRVSGGSEKGDHSVRSIGLAKCSAGLITHEFSFGGKTGRNEFHSPTSRTLSCSLYEPLEDDEGGA